jgi:VWFA-related protein
MDNLILRNRKAGEARIDQRSCAPWRCFVLRTLQPGRVLLVAAVFLAFHAVSAQNPDQPASDSPAVTDSGVVLHQTVRRVVVDVIVTDVHGNPVHGLHAGDFHLNEDGKKQTIRQFESHSAEEAAEPAPHAGPLPSHTFMNLPSVPEKGPLTALLYDVLNTPVDAQPYAHAQMVEFLKKNAGQQIAIFVLSDRLRLLQGFTSDKELLERAATSQATETQRTAWYEGASSSAAAALPASSNNRGPGTAQQNGGMQAGAPGPVDAQSALKHMEALEAAAMLDRRVDTTLEAFEEIGRFLAGVSGRKNLIWFSGSFPAGVGPDPIDAVNSGTTERFYSGRMRVASNLLNAAQVAVYPVDARGLQASSFFDASHPTSHYSSVSGPIQTASKAVSDNATLSTAEQATMDGLASQTGGRAFYNTNGLTEALRAAASDGSSYYTLIYAPTNSKFDGSVRKISVSVDRPGIHLAYRRSYFADDMGLRTSQQVPTDSDADALQPLASAAGFGTPQAHQLLFAAHVDAIGAPAAATPAQMESLLPYQQQAAKAARQKFTPPAKPVQLQPYAIQYAVLAGQLELPISNNGAYLPHLSLVAMAFDADGDTLCGIDTKIADVIPSLAIDDVLLNGYKPVQVLFAPVSAALLRLVVRDDRSGRIGSMEIRLPLPAAPHPAS